MIYGHTLTTYSIPQKENKCNHMITIGPCQLVVGDFFVRLPAQSFHGAIQLCDMPAFYDFKRHTLVWVNGERAWPC